MILKSERGSKGHSWWWERLDSAFIYADEDGVALQELVRKLTGDTTATVKGFSGASNKFLISDNVDLCGPMSGLQVTAPSATTAFAIKTSEHEAIELISADQGAVLLKLHYRNAKIFLSGCTKIIDINAELATGRFDIRDHVLAALPLVLYIRWAFPKTCWKAPETNACLIIDDPVLKTAHGFVNFRKLLALMKRHDFCTNIAFIPWNWRRSNPAISRLFTENSKYYSMSVHGCDHTRAEFGSRDQNRLYWKAKQALERMVHHESDTGIHHDRIMVFPQGIFTEAAMQALKHTDFVAVVNNDTITVDANPRAIKIADVWDIAVMSYGDFPIFTRRYPWEGVENFAFDALLGKPVIVVIHHDFCSDGYQRLTDFVDRLNAINCRLNWASLSEVVRRSYRERHPSVNVIEVEMYGTELRLDNQSDQQKHFVVKRHEFDPSVIKHIRAGSEQIGWTLSDNNINFEIELERHQSVTVRIEFHSLDGIARPSENMHYRFQAMLRRYLCEIRDNYVAKHKSLSLFRLLR